jgi:hypothetical protein
MDFFHRPVNSDLWAVIYGGEAGIRTRGGVTPTTVFETAAFSQLGHLSVSNYRLQTVDSGVMTSFRNPHSAFSNYFRRSFSKNPLSTDLHSASSTPGVIRYP